MELTGPIAISSGLFPGSYITDVLEPLRQAGFEAIQVDGFRTHFDYGSPEKIASLKQKLDQLGLRATCLHAPYSKELDITAPMESDRRHTVEEIFTCAASIPQIGAHTLVLHAGSEDEQAVNAPAERLGHCLRSLKEIYAFCREKKVRMVIEDMLAHLLGGRTSELKWLFDRLPRDVGICMDTGHSFLSGEMAQRLRLFTPRLEMLHVHDNLGQYDDHLLPGEGKINWPDFFRLLASARFRGELVLEIGGRDNPLEVLGRAGRSVSFLKRLIERAAP